MRKVYQPPQPALGLLLSLSSSVCLTVGLFAFLPFAHRVANPERTLELRKTAATDLPPPAEQTETPPPQELQPPPDAPPEPQLAETPQQIPLSADLELAVGSGGALEGYGDIRAITAAQAVQEEAFDVADLDTRPEAVSQVAPVYPPELRKARIEGSVTLVFLLGHDGRVADARVEQSSRPEFEKPALDAIRKWRFKPGLKDGQPVPSYVRIPMRFRVSSS